MNPRIELIFEKNALPSFARLFSKGVVLDVNTGCSLRALLCEQIGIDESYLEQRIQTIFLNGKPVDDFRNAVVTSGDILALSAAMPGLAGATLRRGGYYAAMRGAITHQNDTAEACILAGQITIKVFNLLVPEIGPLLLRRGFVIDAATFDELLDDYHNSIQRGCRQSLFNGKLLGLELLSQKVNHAGLVSLRIIEARSSD